MDVFDEFDNDDSSINDEIQRLWDKLDGMQSSGALEQEEAVWQRQRSSPMPFPHTNDSPDGNDVDEMYHDGSSSIIVSSVRSRSMPVSGATATTIATPTINRAPAALPEDTQDTTEASTYSSGTDASSSDDSSSSSSSSSTSDEDDGNDESESVSESSSSGDSSSSASTQNPPVPTSIVMPVNTAAPSKNPYLENKKKSLLSKSVTNSPGPTPSSNPHPATASGNKISPLDASRRALFKNPYLRAPKKEADTNKPSLQLGPDGTSCDISRYRDEDPFSFFNDDDDRVIERLLEDEEVSRFFHPDKENTSPTKDDDKATRIQQDVGKDSLQPKQVVDMVGLQGSNRDKNSAIVSDTGGKPKQAETHATDSSSAAIIQDYQVQQERRPDIDPSLYAPPVYSEKPRPVLHRFTTQNRPLDSRPKIAISDLFPIPMNKLWQSKFEYFNSLQSEVANMICHSDDNVVVSAPTGAGKTAIFEMGLARFISRDLQFHGPSHGVARLSKHRKAVYFAPSKALCEERYNDWSNRLSRLQLGIEVSMITGDVEPGHCYYDLANSHLILTTPEKWDFILRKWTENFYLLATVKLLMLDEVHLLGDPSRGCCLESIIVRMKTIQRASQNSTISSSDIDSSNYPNTSPEAIAACMRTIAVSATLPNILDVAEFLGANEAFTFDDSYRPVPLCTRVVGLGYIGKNEYRFWMNLDEQIPHLIARYSNGKPTLVFCHTKKETENLVQRLIKNNMCNKGAVAAPAGTVQFCLDKGVAYHHAGMEASERRRVEQAFADRKIKCLCATSTLAVGVNLPAHLVIIKGTKTWRGGGSGYQEIDSRSLLQMVGRAGRPGFDSTGMAIIMTDNSSKTKFEEMTRGLGPAESQLLPKLVDVINTEISHRVIEDTEGAMRWLKTTFLFPCLKANPVRFGLDPKRQCIDDFLMSRCQKAIDQLSETGLVGGQQRLYPKDASHIMSQSMVPFDAIKSIASLPCDATQCQILKTISTMEMIHFPVRRLEKKALNACHKSELVKFKLEGPLSKVRIQSPNEKSFVLLQAYISKADLESFTLRQEMSTMADTAQHILMTAQEYSVKGSKHGQVALQCLKLRRSLQLCLWGVSSGVLNQIQDVGHKSTAQLKMNGIVSFEQAMESTDEQVEKAAGRPKPFGKRLRSVVSKILQEKLTMTAEMEYTRGSNIPAGVQCHLQSPNNPAPVGSETEKAKVTYTLLAYTDMPGTMLFFQEGITSSGSYRFCCPRSFGKLFIHLVASVVGLDETCELEGNSNVHASTFQHSSEASTRNSKKPTNSHSHKKAAPTRQIRNANPKFRRPTRESKSVETERQKIATNRLEKKNREPELEMPSDAVTPLTERVVERRAAVTPMPISTERVLQNKRNMGHDASSPNLARQLTGKNQQTDSCAMAEEASVERSMRRPPLRPLNNGPVAYVSPVGMSGRPPLKPASSKKKREYSGSWNQTKRKQQRTQQRAFASKKDNPFAYFKHDPNDAESFLEDLSAQNSANHSIIPQAKLQELHRTNSRDFHTSHHFQRSVHSFNDTKRRRSFGGRPQVSNQDILRMKAAESQATVPQQRWRPTSFDDTQRMESACMPHCREPIQEGYRSRPIYPREDSLCRISGSREAMASDDQCLTDVPWQLHSETQSNSMIRMIHPDHRPRHQGSSCQLPFWEPDTPSPYGAIDCDQGGYVTTQYHHEAEPLPGPMEFTDRSAFTPSESQRPAPRSTQQEHWLESDDREFTDIFSHYSR